MEINLAENEEKRVIFEGMISFRSVVAAIRDGKSDRKIKAVYFDTAKKQKLSRHLSYVKAMSHELSFPLYFAEGEEIDALCEGKTHGGIVTVCTDRSYVELKAASQLKKDGFYVILDGIEDPYNFAFSVRAAYASGADGLILPPHNWLSAAGNVCRSSAGASELIDVFTIGERSMSALKKAGYKIVCTDTENAVSLADADLSRPLAAVIGGERRGISKNILSCADTTVRIDYGRDFPDALPAASASAIICFEILRRNS
jgi:23S rRNA (guanosine2251-2'-O)-methyltransferase